MVDAHAGTGHVEGRRRERARAPRDRVERNSYVYTPISSLVAWGAFANLAHQMLRASLLWLVVLSGWNSAPAAEKVFDFHEEKVGEVPRGFRSSVAGEGHPGDWRVIQEEVPPLMAPVSPVARPLPKRPVLAQMARDRTDEHFPLLVYEEETFGDFTLSTRFKIVDGAAEQMAGIAFRMQDEKNYYYVRASALGGTFTFFKVVGGVRGPPLGRNLAIAKGVWHTMTIECKGTSIRVLLNGKEAIPALDDKTYSGGKIGFWTKSDSVSYFTDTVIQYKPKEILAQLLIKDALRKYPRLVGLKIFASPGEQDDLKVVASLDPEEVGQAAPPEAKQVLEQQGYFYGRGNETVAITLPLRDNNGEKVAAVRVIMKSFLGQTEKNAVARAMPVVHGMENRIQTLKDLVQ